MTRIPPNNPGDDKFPEPNDRATYYRWSTCCTAPSSEDYIEMEIGDDIQGFHWTCSKCKKPCRVYAPERHVDHDMKLVSREEGENYVKHPFYDWSEKIPWKKEKWKCSRCHQVSSQDYIVSYCTTEIFNPEIKSYQLQLPSCATH